MGWSMTRTLEERVERLEVVVHGLLNLWIRQFRKAKEHGGAAVQTMREMFEDRL